MSEASSLHLIAEMAGNGWHFFPVYGSTRPRASKRPVLEEVPRWSKGSTCDMRRIAAWTSGTGYGLALDCGRSGVVALDADRPGTACHLDLGDAWVFSGHPGRRCYLYRQPSKPIGCSTGQWPAGEVKGQGGYIVVPPSFHPVGKSYRWLSTSGSMVMPPGIEALLVPAPTRSDRAAPLRGANPAEGEDCRRLREVARRNRVIIRSAASGHDAMRNAMAEVMDLEARGHQGAAAALEGLRRAWLATMDPARAAGADLEYARLLQSTPDYLGPQPHEECRGPLCGRPIITLGD